MADVGRWVRSPLVGVVLGAFAGGLVVFLAEGAGHALFGTGNPTDVTSISGAMFAAVLVAWILGSVVGGAVATWWTRGRSVWTGFVVGLVLLAGAVANMLAFPHPVWLQATAVVALPLGAYLAARSVASGT